MPNINDPEFDEPREHPGFRARRARIGYQLGSERIGLSLWEVDPGQTAYPYHFHLTEEEVVIVLEGGLELRTPTGTRGLEVGEVVRFARGEAGAHQIVNPSAVPGRFLSTSTHGEPDIVFYPDSDKVGASERLPHGGGVRLVFRRRDAVDYYDGESHG
jgi:uncharacterized cupin superfamily protein